MLVLAFALSASGITWEGQISSTKGTLLFAGGFEHKRLASRGWYAADKGTGVFFRLGGRLMGPASGAYSGFQAQSLDDPLAP